MNIREAEWYVDETIRMRSHRYPATMDVPRLREDAVAAFVAAKQRGKPALDATDAIFDRFEKEGKAIPLNTPRAP